MSPSLTADRCETTTPQLEIEIAGTGEPAGPLRQVARAEGIGESFASPREDNSDRELERIVSSIVRGDTRTRIYRKLIARSTVDITPAETWLLARLRDRAPIAVCDFAWLARLLAELRGEEAAA